MKKELAQKYNHKDVEAGKYDHWVQEGYFTAGDKSKDPFTIATRLCFSKCGKHL